MRDSFVLDSSLTLAWFFKDEADTYADSVLAKMNHLEAVVPSLWHLEIANAVVMGERRGRCTAAQAAKWLGFLNSLPIEIDNATTTHAWNNTLSIARQYNLTAYDAAFVELASRRGLALATLDTRLRQAAKLAGVNEFQP